MAGETERYKGDDADSRRRLDFTPEIELFKGLVGSRGAAVIKYIQDCHRRRQQLYFDAVQEDSGLEPEEIAGRIVEDERLCDLLVAGAEASVRTAEEFHIRLLARVVAEALTDPAKLDASELRLQSLREMTSQQIGALAVLAALDAKRSQIDSADAMAEANAVAKGPQPVRRTGAMMELCRHFDVGYDMAEALTAALVRHGLIYNDPPGFEDWGLTEYGRSVVGYLSGIDIGADQDNVFRRR